MTAAAEKALQACRALVQVYENGEAGGGSIGWEEVDEVHRLALKAIEAADREAEWKTYSVQRGFQERVRHIFEVKAESREHALEIAKERDADGDYPDKIESDGSFPLDWSIDE